MATDLGVVVGRFQVDRLHEGHRVLLDHAFENSNRVLIVLGVGPLPTTCRKPLPFETRKALIEELYPDAIIEGLYDHPSDEEWSKNLDNLILWHMEDSPGIKLYHSRDSFTEYYSGRFKTEEVDHADLGVSGTLHRKLIAKHPEVTPDFAKGVIWANENKFPTVYSAVDAAIFRNEREAVNPEILLITKQGRDGFMFPGGFAEPTSVSDEEDVAREVKEECGIFIDKAKITYIGSKNVQDWRYAGESDCIRSRLFISYSLAPAIEPTAGDDADTAQWVDWNSLIISEMNPCHQPLLELLWEKTE